jgi:hypothetical protein
MRKRIKNKKITFSISLDNNKLNYINNNFENRSKFIVNLILNELINDTEFNKILIDKKIII